MKKQLLLILFVLPVFSQAQNYSLLSPNRVALFKDTAGNILPIKIDSVKVIGSDSVFYPYTMMDRDSIYFSSTKCQNPNDTNWMGPKIIRKLNGDYILFNRRNDSIIINSLASLNDAWKLFKYKNGNYILATVTSIQNEVILNSADITKEINLTVYDSSGQIQTSIINNQKIKIGMNSGLIIFPEFYYFPFTIKPMELLGVDVQGSPYRLFSERDIQNFDVGDEFTYHGYAYTLSMATQIYKKRFVTNKIIYADSVVYRDSIISLEMNRSEFVRLDTSIITWSIHFNNPHTNLPFKLFKLNMNFINPQFYYNRNYYFNATAFDVTYQIDTSYKNSEKIKYEFLGNGTQSYDSCYHYYYQGYLVEESFTNALNLGVISHLHYSSDGMSYLDQGQWLVYYKNGNKIRGNDTWGNDIEPCSVFRGEGQIFYNSGNKRIECYPGQGDKYEWFKDGFKLNNVDTSILENPAPGWYKVRFKAGPCYTAMSDSLYVNFGITSLSKNQGTMLYELSPNPTSGDIEINLERSGTLRIINSIGIEVLNSALKAGSTVLNINNFPLGIYHAILSSDGFSYSRKILKE
jgi:hypothetical protein